MALSVSLDKDVFDSILKNLPPAEYHIPPPEFTIWQRLMAQKPEQHVEKIRYMLNGSAAGMGRQPTQTEVDALCEITYKEGRTLAYILPLAFLFGGVAAWKSRGTFKFPFYQPKFIKFDPEVFPSSNIPYVKGPPAKILWHNLRFVTYGMISAICTAPLLGSYATSVAIGTVARDDRLENFRKDMKPDRLISLTADQMPLKSLQSQRAKVNRTITELQRTVESRQHQLRLNQSDKNKENFTKEIEYATTRIKTLEDTLKQIDEAIARKSDNQSSQSYDDQSPTQGYSAISSSDSTAYQEPQDNVRPEYGTPRETPVTQSGWGQQSSSSQSGWGNSDSDGWDDASPVAPASRSAPESPSGGSAWDRLRRANQRPQAPSGNTWSGSQVQQGQSGESGTSEKDKAQREFDEMLERERRADDQSSGRGSRW
ncbi:hypothetical protein GCG54_00014826 [Colletotrichum gloeosporioides]|uniref:Uncharacterized protein n=1 Tax=Colletotrichum gloeosporioides TaxID=474922 RepID=A0A8H4CCW6_COLGL|nr:uncharacterized protein GCG54_00014826 [Colletotrichum gloeosporioides]KAF3801610.1 hypothetical protein GCG54_00014826 [Colletotrichum gloeosporioides]